MRSLVSGRALKLFWRMPVRQRTRCRHRSSHWKVCSRKGLPDPFRTPKAAALDACHDV
jgi:hypothetical protein